MNHFPRFLSPDGRCYTYDHRANGYSRGEGAACIILKPLAEAIMNGDTIRGVIRNTGTNQDGRTNGITLPSSEAQEALIKKVYEEAGLDPARTSYVESHGTGTKVGDPLEAAALSRVFGPGRPVSQPLVVGSVKTNIGHLEGASGLAGLIKTVLMLENNLILPNVNFEKANELIPLYRMKLKVPTTLQPWPTDGVRRASVCNYGYGGSNAHIVIDDASGYLTSRTLKGSYRAIPSMLTGLSSIVNPLVPLLDGKQAKLFVLSAFDEASGKAQARRLASYLRERQSVLNRELLDDLAFTLAKRRSVLPYRAAVSASSVSQLIDTIGGEGIQYLKATKTPTLGFVFTGQGAQWYAMGRELIGAYPVFRRSLVMAGKYMKIFGASWSLLGKRHTHFQGSLLTTVDELLKTAEESQIGLGYLSQPLCTALQIALVDLLASWGVKPASVTGHSSGEIAAAYAAGALSQESALAVAYYRGLAAPAIKKKHPHRKGSMLAVGLSKEETQDLISSLTQGKAVVACINSPSSVTVSGDESAIEELLAILQAQKVFTRKLNVEVAYHSNHMDCVGNDYLAALQRIHVKDSKKAEFYSSVTGERMDFCALGPSYWVTNMLSPVEFSKSLMSLCLDLSGERRELGSKAAVDILIEVGPHSALAGPIKQILQTDVKLCASSIRYSSALVRNKCGVDTSLQLACWLFKNGYPINLDAINNPDGGHGHQVLVDLPTYAWNHSNSYWAESRESRVYRSRSSPRSDILGAPVRNSLPLEPRWRNYICPAEIPWVRDHKIQSNMVYPAGGFIAMAIEAAYQHISRKGTEVSGYKLREVTIGHALVVPEDKVETMFCLWPYNESSRPSSDTWHKFSIFSVADNEKWTEHCQGLISVQRRHVLNDVDGHRLANEEKAFHAKMIAEAEENCSKEIDIRGLYRDLKVAGLQYGPTFAIMSQAWVAPYQSIGKILVHDTAAVMPSNYQHPFIVHPSTLDGCIQALFPGMTAAEGPIQETIMPTFIEEMFVSSSISREPNHEFRVYAKSVKTSVRQSASTISVFNKEAADLDPMITFTGLTCSSLPKAVNADGPHDLRKLCFKTRWAASPDFLCSQQVSDICRAGSFPGKYSHASVYIDLLAHKNPHLKCLEINAGTGDATCSVLEVLGGFNGDPHRFVNYDFTDVTTKNFEDVKARVQAWDKLISFKKLDLNDNLVEQGFRQESYDLIIATPITNGSESIGKALSSVRKLLKSEGRLMILESTEKSILPTIIEHEWEDLLGEAGFSGVEVSGTSIVAGRRDHQCTMIVSKPMIYNTLRYPEVIIIADMETSSVPYRLKTLLEGLGADASITMLADAKPQGKACIVLSETLPNLITRPSLAALKSLQRILSDSDNVLWVTRGATIESDSPNSNLISGLTRTMRLESSSTIVTLDLDTRTPLGAESNAQTIFDVFSRAFGPNRIDGVQDLEYSERNGIIMIPRVIEDKDLNNFVSSTIEGPVPEEQLFFQASRPLTIDIGVPGQLDTLRFIDDVRMDYDLPDDYVEIEVKASGVSSRDVSVATGRDEQHLFGHECSGSISAVGKSVDTFKVGDRVVCHAQGTICNFIRQQASSVQILPDGIPFQVGASIPFAYTTAYYSLFKGAHLEEEDTVLVHAAAGSLGQACIQFCLMTGSEIFATVKSLEEKNFVMEELRIPESHIFSNQDEAFAKAIMRLTGNKGVDVIMNSVSGEALRLTWECIAPGGRFVELPGSQNLASNARLGMRKFAKNVTFAAVDMDEILKERPEQAMKTFAAVMSLVQDGSVCPPRRVTTFGMTEVGKALRAMQSGEFTGPLVVMPRPDEMVTVIPRDTSQALLRPDSSYLLVGGLGGLGRAIATWMVLHGARNLIFASRSGLTKQSARDMVDGLKGKGVKVAVFKCDVSKVEELHTLLAQSVEIMPSIRGVIQAAMVIKVSLIYPKN